MNGIHEATTDLDADSSDDFPVVQHGGIPGHRVDAGFVDAPHGVAGATRPDIRDLVDVAVFEDRILPAQRDISFRVQETAALPIKHIDSLSTNHLLGVTQPPNPVSIVWEHLGYPPDDGNSRRQAFGDHLSFGQQPAAQLSLETLYGALVKKPTTATYNEHRQGHEAENEPTPKTAVWPSSRPSLFPGPQP